MSERARLYRVWRAMVARCHSPARRDYPRYGARGVQVCERWRESFSVFLSDMGPCPTGHQLDRTDNSRGYEPANCAWVSVKAQQRNRRCTKYVVWNGERRPLAELAEQHGIPTDTLWHRVARGWPLERALTAPLRRIALRRATPGRAQRASA